MTKHEALPVECAARGNWPTINEKRDFAIPKVPFAHHATGDYGLKTRSQPFDPQAAGLNVGMAERTGKMRSNISCRGQARDIKRKDRHRCHEGTGALNRTLVPSAALRFVCSHAQCIVVGDPSRFLGQGSTSLGVMLRSKGR